MLGGLGLTEPAETNSKPKVVEESKERKTTEGLSLTLFPFR